MYKATIRNSQGSRLLTPKKITRKNSGKRKSYYFETPEAAVEKFMKLTFRENTFLTVTDMDGKFITNAVG